METTYKHVEKCHPKGEELQMIQYVILLRRFLVSPGCCAMTWYMGAAFLVYMGAKRRRTVL